LYCRRRDEVEKERTRGIYLREIYRKVFKWKSILEAKLYPTEEEYLLIKSGNSEEL